MSTIARLKILVGHGRGNYIDTKYHFIRKQSEKKQLTARLLQDGVLETDIFNKPLKIEILKDVEQDSGMKIWFEEEC